MPDHTSPVKGGKQDLPDRQLHEFVFCKASEPCMHQTKPIKNHAHHFLSFTPTLAVILASIFINFDRETCPLVRIKSFARKFFDTQY